MNVLLLSRYDRKGASSRYRSLQFLPALNNDGIRVTVAPLLSNAYLNDLYTGKPLNIAAVARAYAMRVWRLLDQTTYDLIWIEKEVFPWVPVWVEHFVLRAKVPYVVDYDDAVFHRYDRHTNRLVRWWLGNKIDRVMALSTVVVAGNAYLAERAQGAGAPRVEILPTVVDLDRYPATAPTLKPAFTIGWIGSPSTTPYLAALVPALEQLAAEGPVRLIAVGAAPIKSDALDIARVPWAEETEVEHLTQCDVGVMPLTDSDWERGKCGLKLIQYMACARPIVGSPVGMNSELVDHGVDGFLTQTKAEWLAALRALRDDPALRLRQGAAGRSKVAQAYSLQAVAPKLAGLMREAVASAPRRTPRG